MLKSKVVDILRTFSNDELKKFGEFLNSPYHNKNKKAVKLFEVLSEHHPGYSNKNLSKENIFKLIFHDGTSGKQFNDASVRNLLSDLLLLSEKFLSFQRFEEDGFDFNEKCLRELNDRKLTAVFERKLKSAEDQLRTGEFSGEEHFYKRYLLQELKSFNRQFTDNLRLYKDESLANAFQYLSYFYLIRSFKIYNFFQFQKQYNINQPRGFLSDVLRNIDVENLLKQGENTVDKDSQILKVYYSMYMSLSNPEDDGYYFRYRELLTMNDHYFSPLEKYGLYVCLTNSCVQKIDLGKEQFFKECFDVYKLMFEKNVFAAYPGFFSMTTFSAIVNTGIAAGEYDRIEKFIEEFADKLNPEHKEDAVTYSLAQLNFAKGNYPEALEYISRTNTEFSNFKFHLKILSMKISFELEDYESLYYTLDSFKHFIAKNRIVGNSYKTEFNRFFKIIDLLVKLRQEKSKDISYKISSLLKNKSIAGRSWLLKKFNEIEIK